VSLINESNECNRLNADFSINHTNLNSRKFVQFHANSGFFSGLHEKSRFQEMLKSLEQSLTRIRVYRIRKNSNLSTFCQDLSLMIKFLGI
jgi:hypothetical protein